MTPQTGEQRLAELLDAAFERHERNLYDTVRRACHDTMQGMGLDVQNPAEQQADFVHLRRQRERHDAAGLRILVTLITVAVTAMATYVGSWFSRQH